MLRRIAKNLGLGLLALILGWVAGSVLALIIVAMAVPVIEIGHLLGW